MTANSMCFRAEAGAYGRDTRGMIRQHQFAKVELVSVTRPDESDAEHGRMTRCAEVVLEKLGLPSRRMLLCTGDMGVSERTTIARKGAVAGKRGGVRVNSGGRRVNKKKK